MATISKKLRQYIFIRDKAICQICLLPIGEANWNIDHIIPVSFGGHTYPTNLRLTHYDCNHARQDDMSNEERHQITSDLYDQQNACCWVCGTHMRFGQINKVAPDCRLPVSWSNVALVHRACRVSYNQQVVEPWNTAQKRIKGSCIRKILGID